jgi:putative DNA-invertase from lambdoid prophage Rac
MKSLPRVCCYLRVSTDDQNTDSQEAQLKEYCQRRGWTQRVGWFKDYASGAKRNRGALGLMMDEVRAGTVDVVLTWKIDRLARSLNHLAQIIAEFQTHKVALVCPSQGIDTTDSNPSAEFQINILAAVAQFERELIIERVNSGIAAAKQRGVKLGRPGKQREQIEQIKSLFSSGQNAAEISRKVKIPYSTVTEVIREIKKQRCNPAIAATSAIV